MPGSRGVFGTEPHTADRTRRLGLAAILSGPRDRRLGPCAKYGIGMRGGIAGPFDLGREQRRDHHHLRNQELRHDEESPAMARSARRKKPLLAQKGGGGGPGR